MSSRRTYQIADSRLTIDVGSVLEVPADVVVSSDDYQLTMSGGVSAAIRTAGGSAVFLDASKAVPRAPGDVVVTTAGVLPARYVFHVITIGPDHWDNTDAVTDSSQVVRRGTRACLELMRPLGVKSIVFPALGTGSARYPIEESAAAMAEVISETLADAAWPVDVSIMLMSRTLASPMQYVSFYEEFARRVPHVAAHEVRQRVAAPAEQPPAAVSPLLDLEQQRQQLEQELIELRRDAGDARRAAEVRAALERNTDERISAAQRAQESHTKAASVFVSYAHEDEDLRKRLSDHLGGLRYGGYIKEWSDGQIIPGQEWEHEIKRALDEADIILLLITASFLGSAFISTVELTRALDRHRRGEAIVIPVILKPADWQSTGLKGLHALPKDAKPVSSWADADQAFVNIAQGLRGTIEKWRATGEDRA